MEVIAKLPEPKCLKDIRSFLGHARFYRKSIKEFSKIARPLTNLLRKTVPFHFDDGCLQAWEELKQKLISAPIVSAPVWTRPFEVMCDAFNFALSAVLGHHIDNRQQVIYYPSRMLNDT